MKSLKSIFTSFREKFRKSWSSPSGVWLLFIEVVAVFFLLSGIMHAMIFFKVLNISDNITSETQESAAQTIDRDELQKTLLRFEERDTNKDFIKEEAGDIPDMSI